MRIVGYVRTSMDVSLDAVTTADEQTAALERWAARAHHTLAQVFIDEGRTASLGLSGRAGLADALAMIKAQQADGLAVLSLDRLTPDLIEQELLRAELGRRNAVLLSAVRAEQRQLDEPDRERALVRETIAASTAFGATVRELNVLHRVRSSTDDPEGATLSWIERLAEAGSSAREINASVDGLRGGKRLARLRARLGGL